ncbi:uncharacterized protein LOC123308262 isoform X1 [Coccinella septempunctata]|uniref:uncharacterized protein LOC123308262 isoform X1 n=1 Tax=Coccinella septempunctata TaxID=41139 RepID=UPI001D0886D6|nr:uncharacterized protein LOC123308262 isoform X1 [Coccinella septempunctata]
MRSISEKTRQVTWVSQRCHDHPKFYRPHIKFPVHGRLHHEIFRIVRFEFLMLVARESNSSQVKSVDTHRREMQSKWKALRDSYRRTIRVEERDKRLGLNPGRRTKYYYFDQLNFLADHCGPKGGRSKPEDDNSDQQDSNSSPILDGEDPSNYLQFHFIPVETQVDTSPSEPAPKKTKTEDIRVDLSERMVRAMEDLAEIQKKDVADNVMGNKSFLLSLLPFMETLSNEENLQVRVHFMNVLQTYKRTTVKREK